MGRLTCSSAAVVALGAIALGAAPTAGAAGPRQTGSFTYPATIPGASTGTHFEFQFQTPDDPALKPYSVARIVIRAQSGAVTDTTVPPRCGASDAELQAEGAAACPPDTKVGDGLAVSDTGGGGPFPRYSDTDISQFNGDNELIGVGQNRDIAALRTVTRTKLKGSTASTDFPPFPGVPPPDPFTPLKSLVVDIPPYARDGRAFQLTPPRCPRVGYWTTRTDFTYRDGVTQSVVSHEPCTPAATQPSA